MAISGRPRARPRRGSPWVATTSTPPRPGNRPAGGGDKEHKHLAWPAARSCAAPRTRLSTSRSARGHALAAAAATVAAFPPEQADLAFATFLARILMPAFFTRDRPGGASPRKTKKAGDFEFHLLCPWQLT